MDSIAAEEHFGVNIVAHPEKADSVIDTVDKEILRFSSWSEKKNTFHISTETVLLTISKNIAPSNRYYLATTE